MRTDMHGKDNGRLCEVEKAARNDFGEDSMRNQAQAAQRNINPFNHQTWILMHIKWQASNRLALHRWRDSVLALASAAAARENFLAAEKSGM